MPEQSSPPAPWRSGLAAARANLLPGLVLQAAALAGVILYYRWNPVRVALSGLVAFRSETGFAFAIVSTAVFGGLAPFFYLRFGNGRGTGAPRYRWSQGLVLTAFWAYKGFEVDLFYRLLARFVGPGHEPATIVCKVALDQFAYCPIFAVPVTVAVYEFVEVGCDRAAFGADWRASGWYRRRVLPVLISNLSVWVPAVAIIYALPTPLELPLQNLVLCFFTLLVAHQTRRSSA